MATVVRVKRLLDEEPLEAMVINCKRRKTEEPISSDSLAAVLKFAGTVNNQDSDIFEHIKKPTKAEVEENFKKYSADVISKLRQKSQLASKQSRYKVINCFRTINGENSKVLNCEITDLDDSYTVVDIELQERKSETTEQKTEKDNYVYDLYYTQSDDLGDAELSELVSVYPLSEELVYGSYRDSGLNDTDESYDSEDSNAENYWTNDYPDEEGSDRESVREADIIRAIKSVNTNEESDLSSEEDVDKYLYDEDGVNEEDVGRFGRPYARFKANWQNVAESDNKEHNLCYGDEDDYYD